MSSLSARKQIRKRKKKVKRKAVVLITVILILLSMLLIGTLSVSKATVSDLDAKPIKHENVDSKYMVLVNRKNKVDEKFYPKDLVIPNIKFLRSNSSNKYLSKDVAVQIENMFNKAKSENIDLRGVSGYRSYKYQKNLYKNNIRKSGEIQTNKYMAQPGTSEHQTGLAIDILSSDYASLDEGFENTDAHRWLLENISEYGFIIRYPKGKQDITGYAYEPWHLRYVGKQAATEINKKGLTLEEYLNENK